MFGFLKRKDIDWQNSSAHLDFVTYFLEPRRSSDKFQKWAEPMGETVEIVLKRFLDNGLLQKADTANCLLAMYNSVELKKLLKECGLSQTGTKDILAARLSENDPQGVQQLIAGQIVLICTEKGKSIAEAYQVR